MKGAELTAPETGDFPLPVPIPVPREAPFGDPLLLRAASLPGLEQAGPSWQHGAVPCPRPSTQGERWDQGSWLLYALLCMAKFGDPKGHPIGDPSQALPVPKEEGLSLEGTQGWGSAHCNKSCHQVWGHPLGTARLGTGWRSEEPNGCPGAEGAAGPHAPPGAAEHSQPRFPTAPTTCCKVCSCWGHSPGDTALGTVPWG